MGCCCNRASVSPESKVPIANADQEISTKRARRVHKLEPIQQNSVNAAEENRIRKSSWPAVPEQLTPPPSSNQTRSEKSIKNIVNVLLLGESGVGKSTFINALVNYLTFDTLKEARSKKPVTLMPVSFVLTTGHDFDEKIVRYGKEDPNEKHTEVGQSVTQQCKCYDFIVGTRTKLTLIDTPGMGDTRGFEQDDRNMDHILSFLSNLSHINAICILLKPNESKLNVVLRSYFTRLLGFLGENVRDNIVFCFTNTRSTFFAPGDSGPLLKKMLNEHSIKNIPFKKESTFCFDSEAFRYLMAIQNGIQFDDYQKEEYKQSWVTSVNEANRFIQYICCDLKPYPQSTWRSVEHAQLQITKLMRPLLERIRNLHRNIILDRENTSIPHIQLRFTPLYESSAICSKCRPHSLKQYNGFWIRSDDIHPIFDKCTKCQCDQNKHISVYYKLDYILADVRDNLSVDELQSNLDQFKNVCIEFGCFFLYSNETSKSTDPVLSYLNYMIEDEDQICREKSKQCLNDQLYKKLNQFQEEYEQRRSAVMFQRKSFDLTKIYELIKKVHALDLMQK